MTIESLIKIINLEGFPHSYKQLPNSGKRILENYYSRRDRGYRIIAIICNFMCKSHINNHLIDNLEVSKMKDSDIMN